MQVSFQYENRWSTRYQLEELRTPVCGIFGNGLSRWSLNSGIVSNSVNSLLPWNYSPVLFTLQNMSALRKLVPFFIAFSTINYSLSADDCQPYQWTAKRDVVPGQIVCRYTLTSPSEVNYYTCIELADRYAISIDKFFQLNPDLDRECKTIEPNTDYCVAGCEFQWLHSSLSRLATCGHVANGC